jgi:hypothetical protein
MENRAATRRWAGHRCTMLVSGAGVRRLWTPVLVAQVRRPTKFILCPVTTGYSRTLFDRPIMANTAFGRAPSLREAGASLTMALSRDSLRAGYVGQGNTRVSLR